MRTTDLFQSVTDRIISGLEQNVIPWQNPVKAGFPIMPSNFVTKNEYSGINVLLLSMNEFSLPYWATFNQIRQLGGRVKPGERSTEIVYWDILVRHKTTKEVIDQEQYLKLSANGKMEYEVKPYGRFYSVFNLEQTEGIDIPKPARKLSSNKKIELCEGIVTGYSDRPAIEFKPGVACYLPSQDEIRMPELNAYKDSENFYATLFHELAHSTGHSKRLNRPGVSGTITFGSMEYSQEELVAEICASFLCAKASIENTVMDSSISYINAWISKLANDKFFILRASGEAQKAYRHITEGSK